MTQKYRIAPVATMVAVEMAAAPRRIVVRRRPGLANRPTSAVPSRAITPTNPQAAGVSARSVSSVPRSAPAWRSKCRTECSSATFPYVSECRHPAAIDRPLVSIMCEQGTPHNRDAVREKALSELVPRARDLGAHAWPPR